MKCKAVNKTLGDVETKELIDTLANTLLEVVAKRNRHTYLCRGRSNGQKRKWHCCRTRVLHGCRHTDWNWSWGTCLCAGWHVCTIVGWVLQTHWHPIRGRARDTAKHTGRCDDQSTNWFFCWHASRTGGRLMWRPHDHFILWLTR